MQSQLKIILKTFSYDHCLCLVANFEINYEEYLYCPNYKELPEPRGGRLKCQPQNISEQIIPEKYRMLKKYSRTKRFLNTNEFKKFILKLDKT